MHTRINTNPRIFDFLLKRNNYFPNSTLPVLIYKRVFELPNQAHKAAELIGQIFISNKWSNSWKNGIYDYHHYHGNTHECIGVASGSATVILGGPGGKRLKLSQGDLLILPGGMAHKCISFSSNFLCVGAYPGGKDYDINTGSPEEYKKALTSLRSLSIPRYDPVYGKENVLKEYWKLTK